MISLLERLKEDGLDSYIYTTLSYIFTVGEIKDEEALQNIIKSGLSDTNKEKVMTLAELLLQKGREEGIEKAEKKLFIRLQLIFLN